MDKEKILLDSLLDSVITVDKEGKIREVNLSTLKLLGYKKREDLITFPFEKICRNFSLSGLRDRIPLPPHQLGKNNMDNPNWCGGLAEQELIYLDKEGKEIPVSVNISVRVSYPDDIIFMARDISKIKELITELTKSRENLRTSYTELKVSKVELVRSEKLAYTGRIAASIAHEIRNPLTNVAMSIQQLKKAHKSPELNSTRLRYLGIVEKNTERINYLITELLNCARPSKLNLKPYNLHKVLRSSLESTKAKISAQKIKVVKRFASNPPKIMIDREQIGRAFLNIALNAIEAMPKGGQLTVITELNGNSFVAKVQDNGKGIFEKDIIRIFDPFFSTKPDGVGLGLTLCYGIIVSHGGTIEVESRLKRGTIFTVSLPLEQKSRESTLTSSA